MDTNLVPYINPPCGYCKAEKRRNKKLWKGKTVEDIHQLHSQLVSYREQWDGVVGLRRVYPDFRSYVMEEVNAGES